MTEVKESEIEVTPEMVEAGKHAAGLGAWQDDELTKLVCEVYIAMARLKLERQASLHPARC